MKHKDIIISFIFGVLSAFVLVVLAGYIKYKDPDFWRSQRFEEIVFQRINSKDIGEIIYISKGNEVLARLAFEDGKMRSLSIGKLYLDDETPAPETPDVTLAFRPDSDEFLTMIFEETGHVDINCDGFIDLVKKDGEYKILYDGRWTTALKSQANKFDFTIDGHEYSFDKESGKWRVLNEEF